MEKKLLFKNTTQYSKQLYDEFTLFHNKKNYLLYNLCTIFVLILFIYCLIMTIKYKVIGLVIIFTFAILGFIMYRLFSPIMFYKKEVKKKAISKEKIFSFYFYDKYFKIRDNLNFDKIHYYKLYKVYETKNYFYLYFNKKYSFIVSKNGFSLGTTEDFSKFIKNKMWLRYSNDYKK